jgi:hypothetical protein
VRGAATGPGDRRSVAVFPRPFWSEGVDFFTGMGQDNADDMQLLLDDPKAAREQCRRADP